MENAATFPITSAMLSGVSDMFTSAITVAAPVGIAILAIYIGVRATVIADVNISLTPLSIADVIGNVAAFSMV